MCFPSSSPSWSPVVPGAPGLRASSVPRSLDVCSCVPHERVQWTSVWLSPPAALSSWPGSPSLKPSPLQSCDQFFISYITLLSSKNSICSFSCLLFSLEFVRVLTENLECNGKVYIRCSTCGPHNFSRFDSISMDCIFSY